jgi:hypothetical protein
MADANGKEICSLLPETAYLLAYWLQPADPHTFSSEVNKAVMLEPETSA